MSVIDTAEAAVSAAAVLCEAIKDGADRITLTEARVMHAAIREAEGWLESSRKLLEPPGVL